MEQQANITIDKEHITVERTQTACGREINTVARAFNSGYGTAEGLRQALGCLKDIAQAAYEIRKEGFTHAL